MSDHLIRVLTRDGMLRACAADTTVLVEEIHLRQQTDPTATVAVGRLATAAALMSSLLKDTQRLALSIEGNGPLRKLQAEADATGAVRATVKQPVAGMPPREDRFDVAGAIGKAGFLHVVKNLGLKEPYHGMVQLYSSEIAEDIAYYFTTSEQTPSSVGLGVMLDSQARVAAAGGFLLQLMPGADPALAADLETRLQRLPPVTTLLHEGVSPGQLLVRLLSNLPYEVLGQTPLTFTCACSREQTGALLRALGRNELDELLQEQDMVTVTCEFCKAHYLFDRTALESLKVQL